MYLHNIKHGVSDLDLCQDLLGRHKVGKHMCKMDSPALQECSAEHRPDMLWSVVLNLVCPAVDQ